MEALGPTIAIIDDDSRVLKSLDSLLASNGFSTKVYLSASRFLQEVCLSQVDCIVSDIGMPGMSGLELLAIARSARPELPIFLITGLFEEAKNSSRLECGAWALFRKPFDGLQLVSAITSALHESGSSHHGQN